MRLRYILILLVGLPLIGLAQKNVPGYMGKKWSLEYQLYLWPSFNNPNGADLEVTSSDYTDVKTSLNLQSHIVGGYSISKQVDLIVDLNFAKTNFDPYNNLYDLDPSSLSFPEMKATGGAAGIRIYTKHFAPLGSFVDFKVGYTSLKIEDLVYTTNDYAYDNPSEDLMIAGGSKGAPTVTMGFGTNRVFADRFILNYGLDFTFFAGGFGNWKPMVVKESNGDYIYFEEGNSTSNQEVYLKKAAARYAMMCMVNLKIGIGVLL